MAFAGAVPWHGKGQSVDPRATPEQWRTAAGLDWEAKRTPVVFSGLNDEYVNWNERHVLFRSDTGSPLSVVSDDYKIVQPGDVMEFFGALAKSGQFSIETVGALKEGRRIWALARVGENESIMDDEIAPYVMLATSYDGSMATIAQWTSVRVVCSNTLQAALRNTAGQSRVTIPHSAMFKPDEVRQNLGIAINSWDEFIINARRLAGRKITDAEMDAYLQEMLTPPAGTDYSPEKVRASKGYQRIVSLFKGGQIGSGQDAIAGTAWGLLNATTQYVDYEKGRMQDNRLDNAWFGTGARFKDKALDVIEKVAA